MRCVFGIVCMQGNNKVQLQMKIDLGATGLSFFHAKLPKRCYSQFHTSDGFQTNFVRKFGSILTSFLNGSFAFCSFIDEIFFFFERYLLTKFNYMLAV